MQREALLEYIEKLNNQLVPKPITEFEFEENYYTRLVIKKAEHDLMELGE